MTDRRDARAKAEEQAAYEPPTVDDLEAPAGTAVTAAGTTAPSNVVYSAPRNV